MFLCRLINLSFQYTLELSSFSCLQNMVIHTAIPMEDFHEVVRG